MKTEDFRSLGSEAQEALRRRAVAAVRSGESRLAAAHRFGVTRQAVGKWVQDYERGGDAALRARRRGRPPGGSLAPWQAAQAAKAVVDRCPDQLKLPFYLWTREAVAGLIERRFGIALSVWTVGRYLKRWGFTPQKPVKRAFERNPDAVRRWLEEEYPAIRAEARRAGAQIWWGDEMGLRSDHTAGRSYAPRGRTRVIAATGRRFGCSMIWAITNQGRLAFSVFHGRFKAETFIEFLRRLLRQAGRKVTVIVDGHPVHRAGKVAAWLKTQNGRVRVFEWPSHSPDLNPDEMLNQDVKANAVARRCARTPAELTGNLRSYLRSTQRQPHIVRSYFQHESVRYAAV